MQARKKGKREEEVEEEEDDLRLGIESHRRPSSFIHPSREPAMLTYLPIVTQVYVCTYLNTAAVSKLLLLKASTVLVRTYNSIEKRICFMTAGKQAFLLISRRFPSTEEIAVY